MRIRSWIVAILACLTASLISSVRAADADLMLHHGKIVTVDKKITIHHALAVRDGKKQLPNVFV